MYSSFSSLLQSTAMITPPSPYVTIAKKSLTPQVSSVITEVFGQNSGDVFLNPSSGFLENQSLIPSALTLQQPSSSSLLFAPPAATNAAYGTGYAGGGGITANNNRSSSFRAADINRVPGNWKSYTAVSPVDFVAAMACATRVVSLKHCTAAFPRVARFTGVARYVASEQLGIPLSFTVEAGFHCGSHGPYKRRHYRTRDYLR